MPEGNKYDQAVLVIIKEQEQVVGSNVANTLAKRVTALKADSQGAYHIEGDPKKALNDLVEQYSQLFGQASVEVCKEAITKVNPSFSNEELPDILR
jgi:hypothetical protein